MTYREGDLITFAVIYIALAIAIPVNPTPQPDLVHTNLPVWGRLLLWGTPGLLAAYSALIDRRLWIQSLAFGLLCVPPGTRALSYLWGVIIYGNPERIAGLVMYVGFTVLLFRMLRRPEPVRVPRLPERSEK